MAPSLLSRPGRGLNLPNPKQISTQNADEEKGDQLIKSTFELLERGEKEIKFDVQHKDVILILGNTGSGKSTFTQWVAGDNTKMISIETKEGTGEYIIEDHNRIGNSTLKSKTIFPELVVDERTNAAYYDCPGFSDTQGTSHDIATTYFIKKVVDYSENVKMVFTISHPSLRKGVDRQDFMKLLRHVTDFVKDIEKFKDSIAVVATKVDNQYIKQGKDFILVKDDKVIGAIADFLQEVKKYLEDSSKLPNLSEKEKRFYENAIKFVDILMKKEGENYSKIGLFRRPDIPGPVSNITLLQTGKKYIERMLYEKLNFTTKSNEDFGYTVSEKSKNDISEIAEEINENLWSGLKNIAGKIQEHYRSLVEEIRCKIRLFLSKPKAIDVSTSEAINFKHKFSSGYNSTSELVMWMKNSTNPEELAIIVNNTVSNLDVDLSEDEVLYIANQGKYLNFLQTVSDRILSSKPWAQLFIDVETFLSGSKTIILHDVDSASEKINNRIQINLNQTIEAMHSEYINDIKSLEIQKLSEKLNRDGRIISDLIEEIKNGTTTEKLMDAIRYVAEKIGVSLPEESLQNVANQGKYISFLEVLSNETNVGGSMAWLSPFKHISNYFYESGKWYTFLEDLYSKFSVYDIQKDRQMYNVADLEDWGQPGKPQGIAVTSNTFQKFLSKIGNYNLTEYETIKNLTTTDMQIEELNQVLSLTLKHRPTVRCSEPFIIIKGDYVSLNETMQNIISNSDTNNSCNNFEAEFQSGKYNLFKVLALNKVFLDTDLSFSAKGTSVVVIAPKWEVIGSRSIELNGADGAPNSESKAKNGVHPGSAGEKGAPGRPGQSAESFFGVGSVYVNGVNLKITANAGNGGKGQDGGDGAAVVPGRDASTPHDSDPPCENGYVNGFKCEGIRQKGGGSPFVILTKIDTLWTITEKPFKIFGFPCYKGGSGGIGGIGGNPGDSGSISVLELNHPSKITKLAVNGKLGEIGKGGAGAGGSKDGDDLIADWIQSSPSALMYLFGYRGSTEWKWKETIKNNGRCPAGSNGKSGENRFNIQLPNPANGIRRLPSIINEYKIYLRENTNNRFKKHSLLRFLDQLNTNDDVRKVYDIFGLIDEFHSLEEQLHNFSDKREFYRFYSSLLDSISAFAKTHKDDPNSVQNKLVLNYLYTATLGRIYDLNKNLDSYLVTDIREFLNLVKENVKTMQDLQARNNKVDVVNKYKENYKKGIDQKIEEAKSFIKKQIFPEIDNINRKIDDQINSLIEETIALEKEAEKEKQKLAKKREELENALATKGLFGLFHIIGGIVSFFGPIGAIAGAVIEVTSTVGENLALNDQSKTFNLPSDVVSDIKSLGDQIKSMRNQKVTDLYKLLDNVSEEIKKNPEKLSDMADKIADIKGKLKRATDNKFDFKQVKELENELNRELKRKGDLLKTHSSDKKSVDALKIIGKLTQIAQFSSSLLDIYDKKKAGEKQIVAVTDAMEQMEDKIKKLKEYEDSIYESMIPMLNEMEDKLKDIRDKLGGKSQVALDVAKWQVQSSLKDMSLLMQQFTKGFEIKDDLSRSIEKMSEIMTTLINLYDRIQSYQDQQHLANYIADISSVAASSIGITNQELATATNKLEWVIRANIVITQYKSVFEAFKQWVFPLADRYTQTSMLPSQLELDTSIQNLVQNAVKGIESINEELVLYRTTIRKGDQYIMSEEFSSQYNSTQPFFVWKNKEYGSLIANLLSGKEVVLKSDIKDSAPHKDAIKISRIDFNFKTKNETVQSLLSETLKGFDIRAIHIGNSYYRYANKTSLIISNSVTISYSFEKNNVGVPVRSNKDYNQLKSSEFLLSPFTLWVIRLVNKTNSFQNLDKFKNEIDFELSGFGSYIDTTVYGFTAYNSFIRYNKTVLNDLNSNATGVSECTRSKDRLARSLKKVSVEGNFMSNGASAGLSSPINFLCNSFKTYFITNILTSVSQILIGEYSSLRIYEDYSELLELSTETGKFDKAAASSAAIENTIEVEATSAKVDYTIEETTPKSDCNFETNFGGENKCSKSFLLSGGKDKSNNHSIQVPNLNCSLLLADLVTRTLTGNNYKSSRDECLLSPREVILKKIGNGLVQSESDVKQHLQRLLSEKDESRPSSLLSKLNDYARLMFQFFGLAGNDDTETYVENIRNLYG